MATDPFAQTAIVTEQGQDPNSTTQNDTDDVPKIRVDGTDIVTPEVPTEQNLPATKTNEEVEAELAAQRSKDEKELEGLFGAKDRTAKPDANKLPEEQTPVIEIPV